MRFHSVHNISANVHFLFDDPNACVSFSDASVCEKRIRGRERKSSIKYLCKEAFISFPTKRKLIRHLIAIAREKEEKSGAYLLWIRSANKCHRHHRDGASFCSSSLAIICYDDNGVWSNSNRWLKAFLIKLFGFIDDDESSIRQRHMSIDTWFLFLSSMTR